eukprot:CAMPEP_0204410900 /NCGR_PEP_ID=MMETSP0470-20130426/11025_1 /ASSEMBLY_ACC=CAM_ASM_000385 /TAXON_ID=2969 /ORGANISM="Oxyrrhis marina" /LENGTH=67 /DNA_ID=CAMNT_0051406833 /DNA_START=180 /DNA_END=383 /DNA_ORIENTATION=-
MVLSRSKVSLKLFAWSSMDANIPQAEPIRYAHTTPAIIMQHANANRSVLFCGEMSPYPMLVSVITLQ